MIKKSQKSLLWPIVQTLIGVAGVAVVVVVFFIGRSYDHSDNVENRVESLEKNTYTRQKVDALIFAEKQRSEALYSRQGSVMITDRVQLKNEIKETLAISLDNAKNIFYIFGHLGISPRVNTQADIDKSALNSENIAKQITLPSLVVKSK